MMCGENELVLNREELKRALEIYIKRDIYYFANVIEVTGLTYSPKTKKMRIQFVEKPHSKTGDR